MKKAIVPLCLLIIIALSVYVYINRFVNYSVVEVDGIVFNSNAISNNLAKSKDTEKVSYENVKVSDIIYKSNKNYYVGEKKKKSVNLEYPIVSKDSSTLYIASNIGNFVTEDFDHEVAYAGTIITNSKLYNTTDHEQATDYSYLFVEMNNGVYVNLSELDINNSIEEIKIPINSFVSFKDNSINYYYLLNEEYIYVSHPLIELTDEVTMGEFKGSYKQLLINLGLMKDDTKTDEEPGDDEGGDEGENGENNGEEGDGTTQEYAQSKPEYIKKEGEKKPHEKVWVAPEVSITGTYAKTYTYRGVLNISDPAQTISKSPTFEFTINGQVSLRKAVGSKGTFKIIGLLPSTHYEVTAYYEYYDEKGVKRQKKIKFNDKDYSDSFTTEGIDKLNKIDFKLGKVTTDINSFNISSILVNNDIEDEVLNGIKGVTIKTGDANFALTSTEIRYIINKNDFDYTSAKVLKSNKDYEAEIVVTDTAGNILGVKNNTFSFKTKQKAPSSKIVVNTSRNFTRAEMKINVYNTDNVDVLGYRYVVTDENNQEFASGTVTESNPNYILDGLDTAKKYNVKVFCDYVTNENLTYRDIEIGNLDFISYDIEKLGNLPFSARLNTKREDNVTSYASSINVSFANYDDEDPLIDLIDDITINIVNTNTGEIEQSQTVLKRDKNDFITGRVFDFGYAQDVKKLKSNTVYEVTVSASISSGNKKIPIKTTVNSKGFTFQTLKADAYVSLQNVYVASGYIDFDAYIVDPDGAILDNNEQTAENVTLIVYNKAKEKIDSKLVTISHTDITEDMTTNRITFDNLDKNQTYDFQFIATNYNDNVKSTPNKLLDDNIKYTLSGVESNINIEQMIKTINYNSEAETNLFDLHDLTRWKSTLYSGANATERMFVSSDENSLTLEAYNGYRVYSYYLPEVIGQYVTLSFKAKKGTDRTQRICLMNNVSSSTGQCIKDFTLSEDEYTDFTDQNAISFVLNSTGYISFYIYEEDNKFFSNSIILKDFQIEVGGEATSYKNYDSSKGYVGTFNSNAIIKTSAEESNTDSDVNKGDYDYRVTLIKKNERERYDLINPAEGDSIDDSDGITKNVIFDNVVKDEDYAVTFSAYDSTLERYYDLYKVDFETDQEIRVIRNITDFFNMHSKGYYIALADLDFMNNGSVYSAIFNGVLDMQGHKIIYNSAKRSYLFHTIGGGGVIKNADVRYYLNNTSAKGYHYGLTYINYGTIQNMMFTVEESKKVSNYYFSLLGWQNFGTLENFIFHSKAEVYGRKWMNLGFRANYGAIRNGYLYADPGVYGLDVDDNITLADNTQKYSGILTMDSTSGGIIENIYSTLKVNIGEEPQAKDKYVGSIAGTINGSTVRNIYVYDDSDPATETRDTNRDIMFGGASNINYSNLFYISEVPYKETYSKTQQLTALKNVNFQNNTINRDRKFLTDKSWRLNIFPLLDLPSFMPAQDYISIPEITGDDLKFLAVDSVRYVTGKTKKLFLNTTYIFDSVLVEPNQSVIGGTKLVKYTNGEYLTAPYDMMISKLELPQSGEKATNEHYIEFYSLADDSQYAAEVTLSFYNPHNLAIKGVSIDDIANAELVNKPSTNSDYITTVNLRLKNPSLYKSYYTLKSVNTNSTVIELGDLIPITLYMKIDSLSSISNLSTNYILTKDIDCATETCKSLGTFTGKLNGSEHTISNLQAPSCFINDLRGTLENINFVNFKNTAKNSARVGLVCTLQSNGDITNVYSSDTELTGYNTNGVAYIGGLAGYVSSGMISDSSVKGLKIIPDYLTNAMPIIGGIVGYGYNVVVDDCLVRKIDVQTHSLPSDSTGIGGIMGVFASGKISNVYATGKIIDNVQYLGGIVGRATGTTAMVTNVIGNVHIEADQDYVGGINGLSGGTNNVSKSLVLSNLSTVKSDFLFFDRTSGTSINKSKNYAWDKQSLNNVKTNDTHGEILLTQEELWNPVVYSGKLGFGARWDLDSILTEERKQLIPSLIKDDGNHVKGQGYYEGEGSSASDLKDLKIFYEDIFRLDKENTKIDESKTVYTAGHDGSNKDDKYYAKQYTVEIHIENPHRYSINSLKINGLKIDSVVSPPKLSETEDVTTVIYKVSPINYYDSYVISEIKYEEADEPEQVNMVLDVPFFGHITDSEFWKNIEKNKYENFFIDTDVDLSSLSTDEVSGKSFNKLVGVGNKPTIKNSTMNFNKVGLTFIDTIVTDISNLTFDNIKINNSASGNYTGFIKYLNGTMSDIKFHTIKILAKNMSYNGIISINQSPTIRDIEIDDFELEGKSRLGFVAQSISQPITGLNIKNVQIDSIQGDYIGAAIGYENWRTYGTFTSYIIGDNIKINQKSTTTKYGKYIGGLFGYANGFKVAINNSKVRGNERIGGISGQHSNRTVQYNYTFGTEVRGSKYVGGSVGVTEDLTDVLVYNSHVIGGEEAGGVAGGGGRYLYRAGTVKSVIEGTNYVGGIRGYTGGYTNEYLYSRDNDIKGTNYVGGIVGGMGPQSANTVRYVVSNSKVKATNSSAGGIAGYNNNINTVYTLKNGATAIHWNSRIYDAIVANANISARNYGGGVIGQTTVKLYNDQYYNILDAANVTCDEEKCGFFNGMDDTYASTISRIYVYENSSTNVNNTLTLFKSSPLSTNGTMFGSGKGSGKATYNDLKTDALYRSKIRISGINYTEKFPDTAFYGDMKNKVRILYNFARPSHGNINSSTIPSILAQLPAQPDITYVKDGNIGEEDTSKVDSNRTLIDFSSMPLPKDPSLGAIRLSSRLKASPYHEVPEATIYVSGIDTVNIEFSDTDSESLLIINDEEYPIEDKTYSFKYDFNSDFNFVITDGVHTREYAYTPDEIKNKMSVINNNYYYIKDNSLVTNDSSVKLDNAVNILNDKVLLSDGNIYDIESKTNIENEIDNYSKTELVPLHKFDYLDEEIETYYSYSLVDGELSSDQLFVKDDELNIIDTNIDNKKDKIIIDKYNDNEFLLYLGNDGSIYSLKENINFPKEFVNTGIKDISTNIDTNTDIIFVLYEDDNYLVFNYKTGSLVDSNQDNKPSLLKYALSSFKEMMSAPKLDEPVSSEYKEATELIEKLNKTSIDDVLDQKGNIDKGKVPTKTKDNTSKYTLKYNTKTKEYDVIEIKEREEEKTEYSNSNLIKQLNTDSVQTKIKSSKELTKYYNLSNSSKFKMDSLYEVFIIVFIGAIITILLGILGNLVLKKIKFRSNA